MSRGLRSVALAGVTVCVALPLAAGCGELKQIGAGAHTGPATNFTVSEHVTTVVINGGSGSSDVTGSGRGTVLVSQQASYSSKQPTATHAVSGSTLTLGYTCPSQLVCSVSYVLQVPRGVAVRAVTRTGSVTLTSLAGPVTAQTDAGLITADALGSPTADLKSNAGGIVATFSAVPGSVRASTNIGAITLNVPGSASYKINTHTYVGSSTVTVHKDPASPHVITANSDLGSITISPA
jgi:hypothetical protein